jgi:hypothetical protein
MNLNGAQLGGLIGKFWQAFMLLSPLKTCVPWCHQRRCALEIYGFLRRNCDKNKKNGCELRSNHVARCPSLFHLTQDAVFDGFPKGNNRIESVNGKPRLAARVQALQPLQHITGDCDCETLRTNSLRGLDSFAEEDPKLHQMYIASRRARLNEILARGICSCCTAVEHVFMHFSFFIVKSNCE